MNRPRPADVEPVVASRVDDGDVVLLELAAPEGQTLPRWSPGAHIDLLLPSGLVRQYSLCGDPDAGTWRVGVLREEASRGGSRWIADRLEAGQKVRVAGPRSHFPFDAGAPEPVLFLAAGIGITPIVPMALAAARSGRPYELHYSGRAGRMALLDELSAAHGSRLVTHVSAEGTRADLSALAAAASPDAVVYCCGPVAFIEAARAAASAAGLRFVSEAFEANLTPPVWTEPFEVELQISGITVEVPPSRSILEVVEEQGVLVLSSCTEGTCGTCETVVVEGEVDHRDAILTPQERARGDLMYICVSRAACPRLVLEL